MASAKSGVNLAFAGIVILLALTALAAMYFSTGQAGNHPIAPPAPSAGQSMTDIAERLTDLEKLAAENPENPEYSTQIANLYYDAGQYNKAIERYQQSLRIHPQDPFVETDLATCYHYLGQHEKSLEILDKVLKYRPDFSQAKFNKGIVLADGLKDIKGAIAVWEELLQTNPGFAQRKELEQRIRQLKNSAE